MSPILGTRDEALANARRLLPYDPPSAAMQAQSVISSHPQCAEAFRLLGMALRRLGRNAEARHAEENALTLTLLQPALFEAMMALTEQELPKAERLLRTYLREQPDDATALRMLAEVAGRTGHFDAADRLIEQALSVAPDFAAAKSLRTAIQRVREREANRNDGPDRGPVALDEALSGEEIYRDALKIYEKVVRQFPDNPDNWISYGYVLRIVGKQEDALARFRRAIEVRPASGEAWWAIADLKSSLFTRDDVETLRSMVTQDDLSDSDRAQLNFALGRALEQFSEHSHAFAAYSEGNRLRAQTSKHDPDAITRHVDRSIALFDADFFHQREAAGDPARDPIFILGMPRSGSTLLEQILSSHPEIEGVSELNDISGLANWLADSKMAGFEDSPYLGKLASLPGTELDRLGKAYIWNSGLRRRTMKRHFVDKMPNNWLHLGMILTILPNAKIIDARRHPLACGLSNYRQYFAKGQDFTYDLTHIGRFYADYVRLMRHFDNLMPGRVHRVFHEQLVDDPDKEVRRLFDYLEIPFAKEVLRFHENKRAVGTASSEQVRRPINREGVDQWRHFEAWLDPLKATIGPLVDSYPA